MVSPCDFRERAAIFDHTVRGALSPPHTSRAPGFATQDHAQARVSNAAQGNTQDMEATSANLLGKECQGCCQTRRPSRPASRIQSSGAIVTSQPWIQLTGGYARWVSPCDMEWNLKTLRKAEVSRAPLAIASHWRQECRRWHSIDETDTAALKETKAASALPPFAGFHAGVQCSTQINKGTY